MDFEDEVEVAPGIYLSKRKKSSDAQKTLNRIVSEHQPPALFGEASLSDNIEYLQQESQKLKLSIQMMVKTNDALREADNPNDPDFVEAIRENVAAIARQLEMVKNIDAHVMKLVGKATHACGKQFETQMEDSSIPNGPLVVVNNTSQTTNDDDDETDGIYL